VSATTSLDVGWIKQLFSLFSIINFDIEMTKPGCTLPVLTFVDMFLATNVIVVLAIFLVALCSHARAGLVGRTVARAATSLLTTKEGKVRVAAVASVRRRKRPQARKQQHPNLTATQRRSVASPHSAPAPASSLHCALSPQVTTNAGSGSSDTTAALSPTASASQWFAAIDGDDDDTSRTDEGSAATAAETLSNHIKSRSPPPPPPPPPPPSLSRPPPPSSMRALSYRRT
jgi:hypothetical protein